MQVGKTKDQGLYSKSSAAVHPGALAAGSLPQYNTSLGASDISFRRPLWLSRRRILKKDK